MSRRYTPSWRSCSFSIQTEHEAAPEFAFNLNVLRPGSPNVIASMLATAPRAYLILLGSTFIIIDATESLWQGRITGVTFIKPWQLGDSPGLARRFLRYSMYNPPIPACIRGTHKPI